MRALLISLITLSFFTSCRFLGGERISGNGNIVTTRRHVGSFNSIEAGGAVEVRVKQDATHSVKVETDENLFQYLDVFTDGNTLVIQPKKGYNLKPTEEIIVYVAAPTFQTLDVSGASKLLSDGTIKSNNLELGASGASEIRMDVEVSELQADLSGASMLQLRGATSRFATEASGASRIKCIDLTTTETRLDVSGATNAEISASRQLTIEASGASNVEYRGNPNIQQNSSGASSVKKIG
jgi:hypothetical protein